MTLPLRAYLMLRVGANEWSVSVHRDLESVLCAWRDRANAEGITGVLHVGFDRPPSQLFERVASCFPGKMLLTSSAKYSLPRAFEASPRPVESVDGLAVHVATTGWGYVLEQQEPATEDEALPAPILAAAPALQGWLTAFVLHHPVAEAAFHRAGIFDDPSYTANEVLLERSIRYRAGLYRYRLMIEGHPHDPCAMVGACPPWLLDRPFDSINLTVRISNVFKVMGLRRVRDLAEYSAEQLLKIPNFGKRSVQDLHEALLQALNEGPFDPQVKIKEAGSDSLIHEIQRTLASFDTRERDILTRRMGLGSKAQTLQQIADGYNITRERVRQIEAKSLRRLINEAYWDDLLAIKLEGLLLGREFPLPVLGIEALDAWFNGISKSSEALRYALANICADKISVVRIDGVEYVGRLRQVDWEDQLGEARRVLATGSGQDWTEKYCRTVVEGLLAEAVGEFRTLLWQHASKLCHFVEGPLGERVLASYGRGAEQIVEAVLSESDVPLHYSEIAERAAQRSGRTIDLRRSHIAASAVGLLMGRGIFGLEKHLSLSEEDALLIREQVEQAILDGPDDRQWHTSEILSLLAERGLPSSGEINKYVVDILLRQSTVIRSLGRMTWAKDQAAPIGPNNRIDLRQAIVSVLQNAGGPLTATEIRQRLVAIRGVNEFFQISPFDPVVRLGAGLWGLNDRDTTLTRQEQDLLVHHLIAALVARDEGIHLSEVGKVVADINVRSCDPGTIFSLATQNANLGVNSGQYLFLREWGSARRESLLSAVRLTLEGATEPLLVEQIIVEVQARTKRHCDKASVSSCLHALEAKYDGRNSTWVRAGDALLVEEEPAQVDVA